MFFGEFLAVHLPKMSLDLPSKECKRYYIGKITFSKAIKFITWWNEECTIARSQGIHVYVYMVTRDHIFFFNKLQFSNDLSQVGQNFCHWNAWPASRSIWNSISSVHTTRKHIRSTKIYCFHSKPCTVNKISHSFSQSGPFFRLQHKEQKHKYVQIFFLRFCPYPNIN